jgi:hypothetical protein
MVDPGRSLLEGVVEVDETETPLRRKDDPPAGGQGRSPLGKMVVVMVVAGAVERSPEGQPRRNRRARRQGDHRRLVGLRRAARPCP